MARARGVLYSAGWGALWGLSAWAAYCATEFVFSSLLFNFTRPYSTFTSWHWQPTWLLVAAFFATGVLCGAAAGLAVFFCGNFRNRLRLEQAGTLTLALAVLIRVVTAWHGLEGWSWLLLASATFSGLLVLGFRSSAWHARLGYLTNPWVISGFLLGLGQEAVVLNMGTAEQLGSHVRLLEALLAVLLLGLPIGAVIAGNLLRPRLARWRFQSQAGWVAAPALALALVTVSQVLSSTPSPKARAAPRLGKSGRPNVLVIVMDTVRGDHLAVNGYHLPTTPNLQALAQDSVVYTQAMSASDFTLTSHASLFTGMYPSWHGAFCQPPEAAYGRRLDDSVPTLAGLLARQGYSTVAVAANLYMRSEFGLGRGFETFEIPRPVPVLADENWYFLRRSMRRALSYGFDTAQFGRLFSRGEDIDGELLSLLALRAAPPTVPFFAFVNYMDAHFPYAPPPPFDARFPGKNRRLTEEDLDFEQEAIAAGASVPGNYRPHALSQYDGGIAYLDDRIGKLVTWLKQQDAYDDTMIIVTSDHGEAFGERNHTGHANSPYQNLLHVGLLVKYPAAADAPKALGVVDTPVSLVDVAPTVLAVAGAPVPTAMQGRSLLDASADAPREFFSETFPCATLQSPECPRGCIARAVFSWPYKFITSTNGRRQLYDLSGDPDETHDLLQSQAAEARRLNTDLRAWTKTFPSRPRQKLLLGPEALQRLKSLGYVQ
jgi:arylsulfatase A-like enzyme